MRLTLLPNIFYELLTETADGKAISRFFINACIIQSRQAALAGFMESVLSEEIKPEELLVTLYVRYLPTGERIELISTATYDQPGDNLPALEQEVTLYQKEMIATYLAVFNHNKPNLITILWPRFRNAHLLKTNFTSFLLADNYWVFLRRKRELFRMS